mmetsp:Transcript_2076/g.6502  ORF Transcript_2076/g.6502 Transcript_2076/m.6502 type:complete len:96 (+) Transcript_2076:123-410(+)
MCLRCEACAHFDNDVGGRLAGGQGGGHGEACRHHTHRCAMARWLGFGPEGDTWELEANIHPQSKISDFKSNVSVELGMAYVRNSILNVMLGYFYK